MAYPYALDTGLELPLDSTFNERTGPFYYGDTRFGVFVDYVTSPPRLEVWKSTDAGATWTECDSGNHPEAENSPFGVFQVFSADTDGTNIYIHFPHEGSYPAASVAVFDMSTEQWGNIWDGGPDTLVGDDPKFCVRDDGIGVVIWDGDEEDIGGGDFYARIWYATINLSTGSWGSATMLRSGFAQDYFNCGLVAGTSGRSHIFYYNAAANSGGGAGTILGTFTLRSGGSTSSDHEFWNDSSGDFAAFWGQPDKPNGSGKIIFAWDVATNSAPGTDDIFTSEAVSADSPSWSTQDLVYSLGFSSLPGTRLDFGSLAVAWSNPNDLPVVTWCEAKFTSPNSLTYFYKRRSAGGNWPSRTMIAEISGTAFSHQFTLSRVPGRIGGFFDYAPPPSFSAYLPYYWELSGRRIGGMYTLGDSNEIG